MPDDTDGSLSKPEATTDYSSFEELLLAPPHVGYYLWTPEKPTGSVSISRELVPELPTTPMYCDPCEGERLFGGRWFWTDTTYLHTPDLTVEAYSHLVARYICRNCESSIVRMYLRCCRVGEQQDAWGVRSIRKVGQDPPYRVRVPRRVQRLVTGEDWRFYQKARTSESLGLGIAAFTYYRRVVEDIWRKLLDKLSAVARQTNEMHLLPSLADARNNWQFRNAVSDVAPAVPTRLLLGGHNPLTLLHIAFSEGVHNLSDAECLERAQDGRRVLEELIELIGEVLSDQAELIQAVNRLSANRHSRARTAGDAPSEDSKNAKEPQAG